MASVGHRLSGGVIWLPLVLNDLTLFGLLNMARLGRFLPERPYLCHVPATTPRAINTSLDSITEGSRDKRVRTMTVGRERASVYLDSRFLTDYIQPSTEHLGFSW